MGYVVLSEGVGIDFEKIFKVINWFMFKNFEEVRKFIGFVGYFRRFI